MGEHGNMLYTARQIAERLIRYPSTSYHELGVVRSAARFLRQAGITSILDEYAPSDYGAEAEGKTANLYVMLGHNRPSKTLLLYAHTDVVDAPVHLYFPRISDGKLYGRGAADMKGAMAGLLYVLSRDAPELRRELHDRRRRLLVTFVADEERTGTGARRCVEYAYDCLHYHGDLSCILLEPSDNFTQVYTGNRGTYFVQLDGALSAVMRSVRAITDAKSGLLARYPDKSDGFGPCTLEATRLSCRSIDLSEAVLFEGVSCHASTPWLGKNALETALREHPGAACVVTPEGSSVNVLPAAAYAAHRVFEEYPCTASFDVRTNIVGNNGLLDAIASLVDPGVRTTHDGSPAYRVEAPYALSLCKRQRFPVAEAVDSGASDAPHFLRLTPEVIPGFGPGIADLAHSDNEHISLATLRRTPHVIRRILRNFLED